MAIQTAQTPHVHAVEVTDNYGRFEASPLARGYGHTLGNALRRVLLSSLPGVAITRVKVEGCLHEYSTLDFMREDLIQFILNLKDVRFKLVADELYSTDYGMEPGIGATLEISGPADVTDKDIRVPPEIAIVNPDHHLASLVGEGELRVDMRIERGIGYRGSELQHESKEREIGEILMDSLFSPIKAVNYQVDDVRVGRATDHNRLTLEVWTDGTIGPLDAVTDAAGRLIEELQRIATVSVGDEPPAEAEPMVVTQTSLAELEGVLSTRIMNTIKRSGQVQFVEDLIELRSADRLESLSGVGEKAAADIESALDSLNAATEE